MNNSLIDYYRALEAASLGMLEAAKTDDWDGVVRLEETEVEGMRDRIVLPVGHAAMLVSARVAAQAAQFLAHGRFAHGA